METASQSKEIALLVTCMVDQLMPEIGTAGARLLQRSGYRVIFPERQTCCGQPFLNSGFLPEARRLAEHTIEVFVGFDAVVLLGGSCAAMLRHEYARLFAGQPAWLERAVDLAARTYEFGEFLAAQGGLSSADRPPAYTVSYHDSCHMNHTLGLKDTPRQLLTQAGFTLIEMREPERCCGFGGLFTLRMPEVSGAMTAEKLAQAAVTQTDVLVTSDPGCLMQMRSQQPAESAQRIEHLAVVLEEATR